MRVTVVEEFMLVDNIPHKIYTHYYFNERHRCWMYVDYFYYKFVANMRAKLLSTKHYQYAVARHSENLLPHRTADSMSHTVTAVYENGVKFTEECVGWPLK